MENGDFNRSTSYNILSSTFLNGTIGHPIVSLGFSAGSMFFNSFGLRVHYFVLELKENFEQYYGI
jgi:hypothetical protein